MKNPRVIHRKRRILREPEIRGISGRHTDRKDCFSNNCLLEHVSGSQVVANDLEVMTESSINQETPGAFAPGVSHIIGVLRAL
jgi:hypothetical protein